MCSNKNDCRSDKTELVLYRRDSVAHAIGCLGFDLHKWPTQILKLSRYQDNSNRRKLVIWYLEALNSFYDSDTEKKTIGKKATFITWSSKGKNWRWKVLFLKTVGIIAMSTSQAISTAQHVWKCTVWPAIMMKSWMWTRCSLRNVFWNYVD